jgi:hypothetical protein
MASFYAELHVEGGSYRVVHCAYSCHQATDARGRVQAKVRHRPLELVLDVPDDDQLADWAAAAHKPLAGQVVFYDAVAQVAHETIAFTDGQCVQYAEQFASSATGDGAYVCRLTLTASSFELRAGGPATVAAAASAARALPPAASPASAPEAAPAAIVLHEATPAPEQGAAHLIARTDAAPTLSPALAAILSTTIQVAAHAGPDGPANFANAVHADLQAIYDTPTGRQLLDSLHASGKKIYIHYAPKNAIELNSQTWTRAFYDLDGVTPGAGLGVGVNYNPTLAKAGELPWNERPPGIGLAHELIHAEQAAYGRMRRFDTANPGGPDARNPKKPLQVPHYELETIGVHPEHSYAFTENKIRAEWNPPQGRRDYY